jgi:hypothetical protein
MSVPMELQFAIATHDVSILMARIVVFRVGKDSEHKITDA